MFCLIMDTMDTSGKNSHSIAKDFDNINPWIMVIRQLHGRYVYSYRVSHLDSVCTASCLLDFKDTNL